MTDADLVQRCESILGYRFRNPDLLRSALTHASIADNRKLSNERLEFLGDAVMGMIVCHQLYEQYPDYLEGDLTKLKSAVVSRATCAAVANAMGLTELIFVGKGMTSRAERPNSLAAGAFESVIAAMFLDGGYDVARHFIVTRMAPYVTDFAATTHQQNFKSLLQQHVQHALNTTPVYELVNQKGPDHSKNFEVRVVAGGKTFPSAWGNAKKQAEQRAAQLALEEMGVLPPSPPLPGEAAWKTGEALQLTAATELSSGDSAPQSPMV